MFGNRFQDQKESIVSYLSPNEPKNRNNSNNISIANDVRVNNAPTDALSKLRFSPVANHLIGTSWDRTARIWSVNHSSVDIALNQALGSIPFDVDWSNDGTKVVLGCSNSSCLLWDLPSNQLSQIAQHKAPVKGVCWVQTPVCTYVVTASWDKTISCWDLKSSNPIHFLDIKYKIIDISFEYPLLLVSTERMKLFLFTVENGMPNFIMEINTSLKYQHKGLSFLKNYSNNQPLGCVVGCIYGNCSLVDFSSINSPDYSPAVFFCHREFGKKNPPIYNINDVCCSKRYSKIITAGGDGKYSIRNAKAHGKVVSSEARSLPITSVTLNHDESLMAYASGYDWSKGHEEFNLSVMKPEVYLTPIAQILDNSSGLF